MRALLKKLEAVFSGSVQVRSFGRSEDLVVEIDRAKFVEVAAWVRMEESFRLDFLETLAVAEIKGKLQFSCFLRSYAQDHRLVLRTFVPAPPSPAERVEFPSLSGVWTQAAAFESELAPLFGIRFVGAAERGAVRKHFGDFAGFPLRKDFSWGSEALP